MLEKAVESLKKANFWKAILYGQVLSAFLAGTNIFTKLMEQGGLNLPIFQNSIVYNTLLIATVFKGRYIFDFYRKQRHSMILLYVLMVIADVGANYSIVKSFSMTSSLSAMMISSLSSIFSMFVSMLVLKTRYKRTHYAGCLICGSGLGFILYSKLRTGDASNENFGWLGTVLALIAAICYAISNVLQEKSSYSENGYPFATLGAMGFLGSIFSSLLLHFTQDGIDEKRLLTSSNHHFRFAIIGYWAFMIALYTLIPVYLKRYSAVQFNFNLLTADLVVYVFNKFYLKIDIDEFYLSGFFLILLGLSVYNVLDPVLPVPPEPQIDLEKTSETSLIGST
jgi:solute carrier family 35 protein F1/2